MAKEEDHESRAYHLGTPEEKTKLSDSGRTIGFGYNGPGNYSLFVISSFDPSLKIEYLITTLDPHAKRNDGLDASILFQPIPESALKSIEPMPFNGEFLVSNNN